jgi:hypothetical protein
MPSAIHVTGYDVNFQPYPNFAGDMFPAQPIPTSPPMNGMPGNQPNPPPWPAILKLDNSMPPKQVGGLIANYNSCIANKNPDSTCSKLQTVRKLFVANYQNYVANFTSGNSCTGTQLKFDVETNPYPMILNIYGWTAFQQGCEDASFNPLYFTPGYCTPKSGTGNCTIKTTNPDFTEYQKVKNMYDELQYNGPAFETDIPVTATMFDAYVALLHGKEYLNSLNVYAYSVDDDVGNFQGKGSGAFIAVGGTKGLDNDNPAARPAHVNYGVSTKSQFGGTIEFVKYAICSNNLTQNVFDVVPTFSSFVIGAYVGYDPSKCPISFKDNRGALYTFTITIKPDMWPPLPPDGNANAGNKAMFNCDGNTGVAITWCKNLYAFSAQDGGKAKTQKVFNVQVGAPPDRKGRN